MITKIPSAAPDTANPWNKGRLIGQKAPFRQSEVRAIRAHLELAGRTRDPAFFDLAIDSKLGSCDTNGAEENRWARLLRARQPYPSSDTTARRISQGTPKRSPYLTSGQRIRLKTSHHRTRGFQGCDSLVFDKPTDPRLTRHKVEGTLLAFKKAPCF